MPVAASKIDMEEAYAHLPTADPRKHLFAFWSVRSARWRYVQTYYLTFGNVHSVYTYMLVLVACAGPFLIWILLLC